MNVYKPLNDRVLIKIFTVPQKIGSLFVPESAKQVSICRGEVIALGDGEWLREAQKRKPFECQVGDDVIFSQFGGVYLDDKKTLIAIRECDIYMVVSKDTVINSWNPLDVHMRDVEV